MTQPSIYEIVCSDLLTALPPKPKFSLWEHYEHEGKLYMISGVTWYSEDQVFFYSLIPLFPCTRLHLSDCEFTGFDEEEMIDGDIHLVRSNVMQSVTTSLVC